MTPTERILSALADRDCDPKHSCNGWTARCPAHEDRRPSLSISEGDEGRALVRCHTGCEIGSVCDALGLRVADLMPDDADRPARRPSNGKISSKKSGKTYPTARDAVSALDRVMAKDEGQRVVQWTYHNATGDPVAVVCRYDLPTPDGEKQRKTFRPVVKYAKGWRIGGMPEPRPLYGLPYLADAQRVYITEGEKAADAARALGLVATTSAHGSQSPDKTDWTLLAGKECVLLPDNDEPGEKYAQSVAAILAKLTPATVVKVVRLDKLPSGDPMPEHGDIADWVAAHGEAADPEEMRATIEHLTADCTALEGEEIEGASSEAPLLYRPFPTHLLPARMRSFVEEGARAIGCDEAIVALPALAAAAGAIGATRELSLKRTWREPAILWCVVVSPSGAMKSQGRKLVLGAILQRQKEDLNLYEDQLREFEAEKEEYDKSFNQWKNSNSNNSRPEKPERPLLRESLISDTTIEAVAKALKANPRGLLLDRDELAAWFASFDAYKSGKRAGGDAQNWMNTHGAGFIKVNRAGSQTPIFVERACVSVCGTIQPEIFTRAMAGDHFDSGFAARLLIAHPPKRAKRWTNDDMSRMTQEAFEGRLLDLLDLDFRVDDDDEKAPIRLILSSEAQRRFIEFVDRHGREGLDRDGHEGSAWSKLEAYVARLALVMQLFEDPDATEVCDSILTRAIELVEWFGHEAARFYRGVRERPEEREEHRLCEWLQGHDGSATPAEVARSGPRAFRGKSSEVEQLMSNLVARGAGAWRTVEPGESGGRPTRRFELKEVERKHNPADTRETAELGFHASQNDADDGWEVA